MGCDADGRLMAAQVEVIADAGAYAYTSSKVLGNTAVTCTGPYVWPHAQVDCYAVITNNIPAGAFRGFGAPQGHFAAEQQMNKLAEKLGMDPVALRLKNLLRAGDLTTTQTPLPGGIVALPQVVEACARAAGWEPKMGAPPARRSRQGGSARGGAGRWSRPACRHVCHASAARAEVRPRLRVCLQEHRLFVWRAGRRDRSGGTAWRRFD